MTKIEDLEQAIAVLEGQRGTLGDAVVDAALISMREKLADLTAQPSIPEHQRKLLTVLFTDIVGSTELGRGRDPEEILEIIDGALKSMAVPVEKFGGRVTRFMGDGFKAIFGLPVAHEDDTERAIRAGLEILDVSQAIAAQLARERQMPGFAVRVGINTGLVATGGYSEAEDTVMGLTVNLGARLEHAAPPGGLLISHHSYCHVRGIFDMQPVEPVSAKGFDKPVPAYLVTRAKPRAFRIPARGVEGLETPLVGREPEFQRLKEIFLTALQESRTQFVTLVGEPGIGKSRLLYELGNWIDLRPERVRYFKGRATQQITTTPYSLLRDLIAYRFEILESDLTEVARQKLEAGFSEFLEHEAQMKAHFIGTLLGFDFSDSPFLLGVQNDSQQLRERAQYYLQEYLCTLTRQLPVVIFLEDIHYADTPSLETIAWLARQCARMRMVVVCLARPILYDKHPQWDQGQGRDGAVYTRLDLQPLTVQASQRLVTEILQRVDHLPEKLRDLITHTSEGNPFYIEELVKILIDDGIIRIQASEEVWQVDMQRLHHLRMPPTLTALLQARLDSLPLVEKNTLQQAAIIGRIFWDAALPTLQTGVESSSGSLDALTRRELIYRRPTSLFSGVREYIFKSSLMRDVVYETVPMRDRQDYHARVGGWLQKSIQAIGRVDEYAAIIAGHYSKADERGLAASWYIRAGERAKAQGAPAEARQFFDDALEYLDLSDRERRWRALMGRDEVLGILGETEARLADDAALVALAQQMQDDDRLAEAYYRQGYYISIAGNDRQALLDYDKSLRAARRAGNTRLETLVLALVVVAQTRLGELDSAAITAEKALSHVQSLDDEPTIARVLTNLAIYYSEAGDIARAIQLFEQLVGITKNLDERMGQVINLSNLGYDYLLLGQSELGLAALEQSLRLAEEIGARHQSAFTRLNLGLAYLLSGEDQQARQALEQSIKELHTMEDDFGQAAGHSYLGFLAERSRDWETAERNFAQAFQMFTQAEVTSFAQDALTALARCNLAQGNIDEAHHRVTSIWAYLEENGAKGMEFPILAYLTCADVFEVAGDLDTVQEVVMSGYRELMERANKISDVTWRDFYKENVPEHRAIIERWKSYST